jgi:hypothetical protein
MYKDTYKPKHTIVNKGRTKALYTFIQIEMEKSIIMVSIYFFNGDANDMDISMGLNMLWMRK